MRFFFLRPGHLILTVFLALAFTVSALVQHPIEGKYDVTVTGDAVGSLSFILSLKKNGDNWTGEIQNSPQPMNVTKCEVGTDNAIVLSADTDGIAIDMNVTWDNGKLDGQWTAGELRGGVKGMKQSGGAAKPAPATTASTTRASYEGTYAATLTVEGQGTLPFGITIRKVGDKYKAESTDGGPLGVAGFEAAGDDVTLTLTFQGSPFSISGKRTDTGMAGKWETGGLKGVWEAKKK
ncbi:MAG: hypothetical protein ACKV2V_27480 [Blastocatellia bacterium]